MAPNKGTPVNCISTSRKRAASVQCSTAFNQAVTPLMTGKPLSGSFKKATNGWKRSGTQLESSPQPHSSSLKTLLMLVKSSAIGLRTPKGIAGLLLGADPRSVLCAVSAAHDKHWQPRGNLGQEARRCKTRWPWTSTSYSGKAGNLIPGTTRTHISAMGRPLNTFCACSCNHIVLFGKRSSR